MANSVQVVIGADISELTSALSSATSTISGALGQWGAAFGRIGSVLKAGITNPAQGAVAAASELVGAMAKSVSATNEYYGALDLLSAAMGSNTKDAAILKSATAEVGLSQEQLTTIVGRVGASLVKGGTAFKQLGVETTNADGSMRSTKDILLESVYAINALGESSERSAAMAAIFGRGWAANADILDLTPELVAAAEQRVTDLGLASSEAKEQSEQYERAQRRLGETWNGISVALGSKLIPALTRLADQFAVFVSKHLPEIKFGIDAVIGSLLFMVATVRTLWVVLKQVVSTLVNAYKGLGLLMGAAVEAMSGNFDAAKQMSKEAAQNFVDDGNQAAAELTDIWSGYVDAITKKQETKPDAKTKPNAPPDFSNEAEKYESEKAAIVLRWAQATADKVKQIQLKRDADLAKLHIDDLEARKAVTESAEQQITAALQEQANKRASIIQGLNQKYQQGLNDIAFANQQIQERITQENASSARSQQELINQIVTTSISAFGQAFESIITGSEDASKAMLRAVIRSASGAIQAYMAAAMAANFAASSAVPGVGWIAGLAGVAALEGIMTALLSRMPSAAGGWDIPAGLNPVTQLHANEMVLPADLAQPLRQQLRSGSTGLTVNINAMDGASVRRVVESGDFQRAIREATRNGRI